MRGFSAVIASANIYPGGLIFTVKFKHFFVRHMSTRYALILDRIPLVLSRFSPKAVDIRPPNPFSSTTKRCQLISVKANIVQLADWANNGSGVWLKWAALVRLFSKHPPTSTTPWHHVINNDGRGVNPSITDDTSKAQPFYAFIAMMEGFIKGNIKWSLGSLYLLKKVPYKSSPYFLQKKGAEQKKILSMCWRHYNQLWKGPIYHTRKESSFLAQHWSNAKKIGLIIFFRQSYFEEIVKKTKAFWKIFKFVNQDQLE